MKLKLDENLPASAAPRLAALGHDVHTVQQWRAADHLVAWLSDPDAPSWQGCLVVATLHKVRVLRATREL